MAQPLRVLLVDDSPTARRLLANIIDAAPGMEVVGEAVNGRDAVRLVEELRPDVIAMDLVMPVMDGLEATREIMHATPTPIVVISASLEHRETDVAFEAINRGALAVYQKPPGPADPEYPAKAAELVSALRSMAGVQVIHHWKRADGQFVAGAPLDLIRVKSLSAGSTRSPEIVAVACSTGGPAALRVILGGLPADFPVPVVVAQHIAADFVPPLTQWLATVTRRRVVVAAQRAGLEPGVVYLAPGDAHLRLTAGRRCALMTDLAGVAARYVPSGDILLESVAQVYGPDAIGVVLTGMGDDGAHGLYAMHQAGACTVAQDEKTSVVYSMPHEAIIRGAVKHILPLPEIAQALARLVKEGSGC
ncbi:MAG: chemotaxis-specific protein-glutamate methyltransferase CheB [Anaerolineae bacterium]|nr:chemotaxis-specific protein-glutamate methyltransferase CheB [Anaerolineae bacterium]